LGAAGTLDTDCLLNVLLLLFFTPTEDFRLEAVRLREKKIDEKQLGNPMSNKMMPPTTAACQHVRLPYAASRFSVA
jgi:hypothetical protein